MTIFQVFRPVLDALNDGKVVRSIIALGLKVLSVLSVIGGVYFLVNVLKASFDMPAEGIIGGLVLALLLLAAFLIIGQLLSYRANDVRGLRDSAFTVIPICAILFRAFGEVYSTLGMALGIGGCLFMWLTKSNPLYLLGEMTRFFPGVVPEETFLGGIFFFVYFTLMSFIVFVVSYFVAESIIVMADAAKGIRQLTRHS